MTGTSNTLSNYNWMFLYFLGMMGNKIERIKKEPITPTKPRKLCVCESLKPAFVICRIFGMFPITSSHDKYNNCVYGKNQKWFIYSVLIVIVRLIRAFILTDLFNMFDIGRQRSLHPIIASLNEIVYAFFIAGLSVMNIYRSPKFVHTLNHISAMMKENLYCNSSRRAVLTVQYGMAVLFLTAIFTKYAAIIYVHLSDSYDSKSFNFKIYSNALVQAEIFLIYIIFVAITSVVMGMLGCFKKYAISCLDFTPICSLQDIDDNNNSAEFIGLIDYKLCTEIHRTIDNVKKLPFAEVIEYLRCLHEEVCMVMYEMNDSLNPQFVAHVSVELVVLILNWYTVIMFIAYVFSNPIAKTLHFLNLFYIVMHTLAFAIFLKQAQQLQNLVSPIVGSWQVTKSVTAHIVGEELNKFAFGIFNQS